jgi:microsomal epoxide hydrolase
MAITVARKWPEESDLMNDLIEPFQLSVPEAQLADLRNRLSHTRWPERETVTDTSQGPKLQKIQALAAY